MIQEEIAQVPPGALFEHYKGERYTILSIVRHSDTLEYCVVYQGLYHSPEFGDNPLWVRSLKVFLEKVVVEGKEIPRFRRLHS